MKTKLLLFAIFVFSVLYLLSGCYVNQGNAPSAPVNPFPVNGELLAFNNFTATWNEAVDPEGGKITYRVRYSKDPQNWEFSFLTDYNHFPMLNLSEGTWFWKVEASDTQGKTAVSETWNFTIGGDSLPVVKDIQEIILDPVQFVQNTGLDSFTLQWPEYSDPQNPAGVVTYVVYLYLNEGSSPRKSQIQLRSDPLLTVYTNNTF